MASLVEVEDNPKCTGKIRTAITFTVRNDCFHKDIIAVKRGNLKRLVLSAVTTNSYTITAEPL